jgi:hypothetical protein
MLGRLAHVACERSVHAPVQRVVYRHVLECILRVSLRV